MLESMSMTNKPFHDSEYSLGTPGHILSCIPPLHQQELFTSPARTIHEIAGEMRAEIMNPEVHQQILAVLKDFENNYEIAETPYGWVRMSDAVSMSEQMSTHYYRRGNECPIKPAFIGKHHYAVDKTGPNTYYYLPNVENSVLPEKAFVYKKRFYYRLSYIEEYFEHEYAYRMPLKQRQKLKNPVYGPAIVCNNWYYGWHAA